MSRKDKRNLDILTTTLAEMWVTGQCGTEEEKMVWRQFQKALKESMA